MSFEKRIKGTHYRVWIGINIDTVFYRSKRRCLWGSIPTWPADWNSPLCDV